MTVKGKPRLVLSDGDLGDYASGSGSDTLLFTIPKGRRADVESLDVDGGTVFATQASAMLRMAGAELQVNRDGR